MKKIIWITAMIVLLASPAAFAGPFVFGYKLKPGKKYVTTMSSQTESNFMGQKNVSRSRTVIEYMVMPGIKKDWVSLVARIRSQKNETGQDTGQMTGLYQIEYRADMHQSGEIRNIKYTGAKLTPEMEEQVKTLPPETAAMVMQSADFMAEQWKDPIFWFPEFTENKLRIGDQFEVTKKGASGSPGSPMQNQYLSKQVFTLESVVNGLASFSVEERSMMKTSGAMGSQSNTKSLAKSEAIFDLKAGLWIELVSKYRSQVQFSGGMGTGAGAEPGTQEVFSITKYEMSVEQ
jgi:hypothetical protein